MAVSETLEQRLEETREFVKIAKRYLPHFVAPVALQVNWGCPNVGRHDQTLEEIGQMHEILAQLQVPLVANFSVTAPIEMLLSASSVENIDALWIANTILWGHEEIDWYSIFGTDESPLIRRGFASGGGLSGPACLNPLINRLIIIRDAGVRIPIVAGNGIQRPRHAKVVLDTGANALAIGSIAIMRPWRMRSTIDAAIELDRR